MLAFKEGENLPLMLRIHHGSLEALFLTDVKVKWIISHMRKYDMELVLDTEEWDKIQLVCHIQQPWLVGLGVWFSLRVREVPGSNPG